jgi:pectin methylesterase-like acyl-CoA thioesterase
VVRHGHSLWRKARFFEYQNTGASYTDRTAANGTEYAYVVTGATYGTGASQSVLVKGNNVTVKDLTIENSFDEAAVVLAGGNQYTLLVDSPEAPVVARSYFVNSYIEGDVDFIFGRGTAVFSHSTIHALSRGSSSNNGYITAASTSDKNPNGFLITDSTITSNAPAGTFSLGRPWRGWTDGYTKNGVVYNSRGSVTIRDPACPPRSAPPSRGPTCPRTCVPTDGSSSTAIPVKGRP